MALQMHPDILPVRPVEYTSHRVNPEKAHLALMQ